MNKKRISKDIETVIGFLAFWGIAYVVFYLSSGRMIESLLLGFAAAFMTILIFLNFQGLKKRWFDEGPEEV